MKRKISANKAVEEVNGYPKKVALTDEKTGARIELDPQEVNNLLTTLTALAKS